MTLKKSVRAAHNPAPEMLEGLQAIGNYIGRGESTVIKYITGHGLPATRLPSGKWFTTKRLIDQWILAGYRAELEARGIYKEEDAQLYEFEGNRELIEMLAEIMGLDATYEEIAAYQEDSFSE